jgi:hypothetical protein
LFISSIQQQTPEQRAAVVAGITALAESRKYGFQLYTTATKLPDRFAQILFDASKGATTHPISQIRSEEMDTISRFLLVEGALRVDSRWQRSTAQKTVATIIREEIAAERIVPVFMRATFMVEGGEIPLHAILSASQWKEIKNRA